MAETHTLSPILKTKLYRPPVTADYTHREALHARLQAGIELPLTLVCAPAGYGKSTSISHWLESSGRPSAWLSLDKSDSDLRTFLSYLVATLQAYAPGSCPDSADALVAPQLPDASFIAVHLTNDIEALEERVTLVLDDFQRISDTDIHRILDLLLEHPLRNLHLVILSRRDPILSLSTLRARHLVSEIRLRDLKFSRAETETFITAAADTDLPAMAELIEELQKKAEGWPAGLRLAKLALHNREDAGPFLARFGTDTRPLQEYLISEVLSSVSADMREKIVFTSVLDRFNAAICEYVWDGNLATMPTAGDGRAFIDTLQGAEFFCIALDEGQEWFRFHHLFQGLLSRQLADSLEPGKLAELHQRAARWFFDHGYFEDAIHHAQRAEDRGLIIEIIGGTRHELMDTDQWHRLETWLKPFPVKTIQQQPQLLLTQCWLDLYLTYRLDILGKHIEQATLLLEYSPQDTPKLDELKAELKSLEAVLAYIVCDSSRSATLSRECLQESPIEYECVRSSACWIQIMSDQMRGEPQLAESLISDTLGNGELQTAAGEARLWTGAAYSAWCEADTGRLREIAERLQHLAGRHELDKTQGFAHQFQGLYHYERNELDEAISQFEAVADNSAKHFSARVVDCTVHLSLCHQALGNDEMARKYLDQISAYVLENTATLFLGMTQALHAEIDMLQGHIAHASHWASRYTPPPPHSMQRYYQTEFVAAKILLACNTPESRGAAADILDYLHKLVTGINHRRFLIAVLILKSQQSYLEADEAAAVTHLGEAFELGKPGRLIRPFANLEPEMIPLLNRLELDAEGMKYLGAILAGLPQSNDEAIAQNSPVPEVLSQRELEILELLAMDFSNKAIAEKLFISTGTVKRHAHNIFNKLGVKGRRPAVSKALGLGIISSS